MNRNLKAEIIRRYGAQYPFAAALGVREAVVSAVVREQRHLNDNEKQKWAEILNRKPEEIFPIG